MTAFYLLGYASGQGFGLGLCNNEGLRYDSENWYTKQKNETPNWKQGTNLTVKVEELADDHKLDNEELLILQTIRCLKDDFKRSIQTNGSSIHWC